jgi:mannose-6-phosphate isomerase-like protein (cupin superfamily)
MRITIAAIVFTACMAPLAPAQAPTVDHWTPSQILAKAAELDPKAHGPDGAASTKLEEYPNHYTMVALRHKDGGGELHENFADFFYVVKGHATLLTGGALQDAKAVAPGELRGSAVLNGAQTILNVGDVVHIPAGVPHQLLVATNSTFVYFVIKVKEK